MILMHLIYLDKFSLLMNNNKLHICKMAEMAIIKFLPEFMFYQIYFFSLMMNLYDYFNLIIFMKLNY